MILWGKGEEAASAAPLRLPFRAGAKKHPRETDGRRAPCVSPSRARAQSGARTAPPRNARGQARTRYARKRVPLPRRAGGAASPARSAKSCPPAGSGSPARPRRLPSAGSWRSRSRPKAVPPRFAPRARRRNQAREPRRRVTRAARRAGRSHAIRAGKGSAARAGWRRGLAGPGGRNPARLPDRAPARRRLQPAGSWRSMSRPKAARCVSPSPSARAGAIGRAIRAAAIRARPGARGGRTRYARERVPLRRRTGGGGRGNETALPKTRSRDNRTKTPEPPAGKAGSIPERTAAYAPAATGPMTEHDTAHNAQPGERVTRGKGSRYTGEPAAGPGE